MARKEKKRFYEQVEILDVAAEGKCVARVEGDLVVFVDMVVPGDVVDIRITKKKKKFLEGRAEKFHKFGATRIEPICSHFGLCGGCKWQNLEYEKQLFYKQKQVVDNIERIGKLEIPEVIPILPSPSTQFYRNKLEFTFSSYRWLEQEEIEAEGENIDRRGLGFHLPGRWDRVLDIEKCFLQPDPSNSIRDAIKAYAKENDLTFHDAKTREGYLRVITIRTANTGDVMLIVQVYEDRPDDINGLMEFLKNRFPEITSLNYVVNTKNNDTIFDQEIITYHGVPYIVEEMEGLKFRVGPKSFFQTNSIQAYNLYKVTRDFAELKGDEVLYDLYTGTGTIGLFMSKSVKSVIGLEYVESAIEDAKKNAKLNNIENCSFYAGDMKDLLNDEFVAQHPQPDVIITDPPRAGMHPDVVEMLLKLEAPKIVYVSCNPATQARDMAALNTKYYLVKIQPVDMFPHTMHVENVALLKIRK